MTTPNHIAGGLVITGISCSLFNVNIFANPLYVSTLIFCSLLPDIDHTKSIIGKVFYPIAKFLSSKFGHRTFTHSALFLAITTVIGIIISYLTKENAYQYIIFFAVFSHIMLDMVTLHGVVFFYPFLKNKTVIPANPDLRFKTGDLKAEGITFFLFAVLFIFLQDLFKDGFWQTYNKQFNSVLHIDRQNKITDKEIEITYNYDNFGKSYKGKGILMSSNENEIIVLNDSIHIISKQNPNQNISKLDLQVLSRKMKFEKITFENYSVEKLNAKLKGNFIQELKISSSENLIYHNEKEDLEKKKFTLKSVYSPQFFSIKKDTLENYLNEKNKHLERQQNIEYQIQSLEIQLNQEENYYNSKIQEINQMHQLKNQAIQKTKSSDVYTAERGRIELIEINRNTSPPFKPNRTKIVLLQNKIKSLKSKLKPFIFTSQKSLIQINGFAIIYSSSPPP